jgi:ribose transport system substrate-binding protein
METKKIVLSLITNDNDFQREQAVAAEKVARRIGVSVEILYAQNDAVTQSQQLLKIIQSSSRDVDAIIVEPAGGTALAQVAQAAVAVGIGWVLLNRDAEYLDAHRASYKVPSFSVSSDHEEIGRIQARQFAALLPRGGTVLYIQGPSNSTPAKLRLSGVQGALSGNIHLKLLRSATWTEAHGYQAVDSWLRLSTSRREQIDVVSGQNDYIAMGARKAFKELCHETEWERWSKVPFTGVDGLENTGQAWVSRGLLTATVVLPPNTVPALEMLVKALRGEGQPPILTLVTPASFPELKKLGRPA